MIENLRKEFPWPPTPQQVAVWVLLAAGLVATIVKIGAAPPPAPVVVAARDLPAFTRLAAADLTVELRAPAHTASLADVANAEGRLLTAPLKAGAVLESTLLLSPTVDLQDWWTLRVPISMTATPEIGDSIIIVGVAAAEEDSPPLQVPAFVLAVDGDHVTVAVAPDAAPALAAYQVGERALFAIRALR